MSKESVSYPVRMDLPRYDRVPILAVGEFYPEGVSGKWTVTSELLESFASTYDPHFYASPVSTDHEHWWGPALGIIAALYVEDDVLYADFVNVDPVLAWQIDNGQWPARSVYWWQEDIIGQPFYDDPAIPNYIQGITLLGQRRPAVPSLGPMPARSEDPVEDQEPVVYAYPLVASHNGRRTLGFTNKQEVVSPVIDNPTPAAQAAQGKPPAGDTPPEKPAEQAGLTAAELQQENEALKAQLAEIQRNKDDQEQTAVERLTAENAEIKAQLAANDKSTALDKLVAELTAGGYLTPANREQFLAGASQAYDGDLALKAGGAENPTLLSSMVDTLKASGPKVPRGAIAGHTQHAGGTSAGLSAAEKDVAAQLGMSDEQYRGVNTQSNGNGGNFAEILRSAADAIDNGGGK